MQDNLVKEQKDSNIKPNLMVHVNPHTERIAVIRSTIDALYDIRLNLSLKKIIGPFIKRNELKRMIDDAKAEISNIKVKEEIDKVFEEYLDNKKDIPLSNDVKKPDGKDIGNENKPIVKSEVESKIDSAINEMGNYSQGQEKGVSLTKSTKYFKNSNDDKAA